MSINLLKYLLCAILFLGFIFQLNAQQPILFDHLGIEKGLSQNSVFSISQDKGGFLWFGTRYGLNRYDGYNIKVYQRALDNPNSISNNYVTSLYCDSKKNLWVGTSSGLNLYNEQSDDFKRIINEPKNTNSLSDNTVNCIYEDKKGNVWIGTGNGLNKFVNGKSTQVIRYFSTNQNDGPYRNIRSIFEDRVGNIWLGTANGLLRMKFKNGAYQTTIFTNNNKPGDISDNYISKIIEDAEHHLWVGTQNGGLNLFNASTEKFRAFKHSDSESLVNNTIRSLMLDDVGKLWIGTLDGISIMDTKTFACTNLQYEPDNRKSLSQNSVYSLYKDQNGSVWVGTYFGGANINYPYSTAFNVYNRSKSRSSINSNVISSFVEDEFKNLWVGTEGGGLNYFNQSDQSFTQFKNIPGNPNSLSSNLIKKVFIDKTGKLWIGTHAGGLNAYDSKNKTFRHFNFDSKTQQIPDEIVNITEDEKKCLWIASQLNGIKVSNPEKTIFRSFNLPKEYAKGSMLKSFLVGHDQKIYIGTTNGLFIYNQKKAEIYAFKQKDSAGTPISYYVNCIIETRKNQIYLGTSYDGMILFDQKNSSIIRYTEKNGLPNNNVLGILEDEKGNLWISTANGLSMFNPSTKVFKNYTVADGLPGNEFNTNAFFKSSNGEMFFGGYNGFISFYPDKIQTNIKPATIVLTDLKRFNKSVKINDEEGLLQKNISFTDQITFENDQNTFSLSFALLNFIKPEKNRYAYKLDGFEKNWNYVNTPSATYTNLPSGSYTFLVKGINNDGVYSANTKTIKIIVNPPFYRTWWAYLFYLCLAIGILVLLLRYLLIRAVLKKEKEINEHKLEFFTNISHEIRTPLTLIVGPLEKLIENTKDDPALNRDLQPIKSNADRLMNLVTELLDFRKAESGKMILRVSPGNIVKFCKEIFIAFQNMAISNNINYSFETEQDEIELYFDKVQLEKVLFNLLSNAFKFTPKSGKINLAIKQQNDFVNIQICDNGKGVPLEAQANLFNNFYQANPSTNIGTGLGLSLSKSIIELHHGKISFESTPQQEKQPGFTCFTINLKSGKDHFKSRDFIQDYVYYDDAINYHPEINQETAIDPTGKIDSNLPKEQKKYSILLVEDNTEVRTFISNSLQENYTVFESEDGLKGWEAAIELIPDLIISDVMMPVMDGLELCRKLKTDERTSHIPVILLTARSAYVHQVSGFENGADAYIMKPFNLKILQLNIHNLLNARETIKRKFAQVVTLEPKNLVINTTEQNFLNKIIQIIEDHIADPEFDVPSLSSKIGMSQPVLYKKIRALTDFSVNDFIKSLRLKKAVQMLKSGAGNISEVAYSVGFNDRKYFSIEFKKYFGKTPSEFIQEENEK